MQTTLSKASQFLKWRLRAMQKRDNVNVRFLDSLPCFLCGDWLEQRIAKSGKPYFVCDTCGTQFFVRKKEGITRLGAVVEQLRKSGLTGAKPALLPAIQQKLSEIEGLKKEIKRQEDAMGFFPSEELVRVRNSL